MMIVFHALIGVLLIIAVLMQSAKGEGLAGAFGGGGGLSGAVFGGRGAASFLSKATTALAVIFFLNCGILAFMSSNRTGLLSEGSVVTEQAAQEMERQQAASQALPNVGDTTLGLPTDGGSTDDVPVEVITPDGSGQ